MSALDAITVKVVREADAPTGNADALLFEVAAALERLVNGGGQSVIDVASLPLTLGDYEALREALGEGAVSATVQASGATEVRESAFPGVWWVTHFNEAGDVVADLIEICATPQILASPSEDVADGLVRLRAALTTTKGAAACPIP